MGRAGPELGAPASEARPSWEPPAGWLSHSCLLLLLGLSSLTALGSLLFACRPDVHILWQQDLHTVSEFHPNTDLLGWPSVRYPWLWREGVPPGSISSSCICCCMSEVASEGHPAVPADLSLVGQGGVATGLQEAIALSSALSEDRNATRRAFPEWTLVRQPRPPGAAAALAGHACLERHRISRSSVGRKVLDRVCWTLHWVA